MQGDCFCRSYLARLFLISDIVMNHSVKVSNQKTQYRLCHTFVFQRGKINIRYTDNTADVIDNSAFKPTT
jgi:hypothetical protein